MKNPLLLSRDLAFLAVLLSTASLHAAQSLNGFPFTDESLTYNIAGPGKLNLGQAHLRARHSAVGWNFDLSIDAGIPGFSVKDNYSSQSNPDFCSASFTKQFARGSRSGAEEETIDRSTETATRTTVKGGGKSEFAVSDCIKDALTLLFYTRREMGQGRVPPEQDMLFGSIYDVRLVYTGAEVLQIAQKPVETDKLLCTFKGPSSSLQFEIYFARDAARTPLRIVVPLGGGKFSMELVH